MTTILHTAETRTAATVVKNVALFVVAPFVALAYVIAFPFVGLGMLAWCGARAAAKNGTARKIARTAKYAGLMVGAPLVALAYVVLFPVVGLVMLAWMATRAWIGETEEPALVAIAAAA